MRFEKKGLFMHYFKYNGILVNKYIFLLGFFHANF